MEPISRRKLLYAGTAAAAAGVVGGTGIATLSQLSSLKKEFDELRETSLSQVNLLDEEVKKIIGTVERTQGQVDDLTETVERTHASLEEKTNDLIDYARGQGQASYTVYKRGRDIMAVPSDESLPRYSGTDWATVIQNMLNGLKGVGGPNASTIYNRRLVIKGDGEFRSGVYLPTLLDIPPMQNCVFDARDVTFTGAGIRFDSFMDTWIYLGIVAGNTNNIALDLDPRTAGPDNSTVITDSQVYLSSIAGSDRPPAGSVGLRLRANTGPIYRAKLDVAGGIWGFEKLIYSPDAERHGFHANEIRVRALYTGTTGVQDGDGGAANHLFNRYFLHELYGLTTGVSVFGDDSIYEILHTGWPGLTTPIVLQRGAERNLIIAAGGVTSVIDDSGNNTNRIISPGFQANVGSGTFALDGATGVRTLTIPHGLFYTPAKEDCAVFVTDVTDDNARFGPPYVTATDANNVTVKIAVTTAGGVGSTARIGLRVGKP